MCSTDGADASCSKEVLRLLDEQARSEEELSEVLQQVRRSLHATPWKRRASADTCLD